MNEKVVFYDAKPYDRESFERLNRDYGFEITWLESHLTDETARVAMGADAVCVFVNDTITPPVVDTLHQNGVTLIALRCAGYNNVDLAAVYKKMHVVRVPAYSPRAVAEHAVALMMSLNRKTHRAYYRVRDNNFSINGFLGFDMFGKTAGVIGTGRIGQAVIDILLGFGMKILAVDSHPSHEFASGKNVHYVDLPTLYAQSDIITLHCPLTPDNLHMINSESIATMKDGVMIINTGRGKLIDTRDLITHLKTGKVGAAGLDVYEEEGDFFFEDLSLSAISDDVLARLLTFPNVLVTSHQAFFTREAMTNIALTTLDNIQLFFDKGLLPNEICYRCSDATCARNTTGRCF